MTASAKGADVEQWANSAEWRNSAKGAEYDSQGQARSKAERVAPGHEPNPKRLGLKGRNISRRITPFQGYASIFYLCSRGDALRFATCLPLAVIFRAFGATLPPAVIFCVFGAFVAYRHVE